MAKQYHKLVRDLIPQLIEQEGGRCDTLVLDHEAYLEALDDKLVEECGEYLESGSLEEMADVLEVLYAILKARGYSKARLEAVRKEKSRQRGGFQKRIFLKYVE